MELLIILVPLVLYLVAWINIDRKSIKTPWDYFTANKKVDKTEFTSSSIAYWFQVSTIYPFLLRWASMFLFVPFVNAVFWWIWILLFYFCINRIFKYLWEDKTIHWLLGKIYWNHFRTVWALLTILWFIWYIIAELWFWSRVLLSILPGQSYLYFIVFLFIFFIALYLFRSWQLGSFHTDQVQLWFTYFWVFWIIIYLLYTILWQWFSMGWPLTRWVLLLAIFIPIILIVRKLHFISFNWKYDKLLNWVILIAFASIFILSLLLLISNPISFELWNFYNLEWFWIPWLLALIILPLWWQFVDLTNRQRLLAVKKNKKEEIKSSIKKWLLTFSIESPFTWILFLVFWLLITVALPDLNLTDILIDFPEQLINSWVILQQVMGYTFIMSIISIMLSTVDSFIMGISFTYTYDINKKSRNILDHDSNSVEREKIIKNGKLFGFGIVFLAFMLFIFFDQNITWWWDLFINLLLSFYSASLALLPFVLWFIFLKKVPTQWRSLTAILVGALSWVWLGVYSVLFNPTYAWYPVIVSVLLSSIIYILWLIVSRNKAI